MAVTLHSGRWSTKNDYFSIGTFHNVSTDGKLFLGPLKPRWDPISFTTRHMNDYFIFGTLNHVCTNEKFDSMYGWYGSNAQNMWKIANFGLFLMIFGTFGAPKGPYILLQMPYEWLLYLWDTQSCMYQWEIWFNVWVIWL